ncbi:MAG: 50S ribosomal protein L29 [Chromatiales bacterium]
MRTAELRKKTAKELNELLLDLRREQFSLRMQQGTGQAARPSRIRELRRSIARIKTLLKSAELGAA